MPHIAILGAGISGLAVAWFLKKILGNQAQLTILEKSQRVGGWIETAHAEGFLCEQGPRSYRTKGLGAETLALVEDLGLQEQMVFPQAAIKNRYLFDGQRLQCVPQHLWEIPFNPLTRHWLSALWRDWRMPKRQEDDESIYAFFARRLGIAWTERLIDPLVLGIYAGDSKRLSLKSCFPLFDQWEQQEGSLLRGAWHHRASKKPSQSAFVQSMQHYPLFSFKEGMEVLPRALGQALKNEVRLGQAVKGLKWDPRGIEVQLEENRSLFAHYVISTLPAFALSSLCMPYCTLANHLEKLSYASLFVVNVGFSRPVLPMQGFGYLVPSYLGLPILGCVWDSCLFSQQNQNNQTRLTLMMGGSQHVEFMETSESGIVEYALRILREHLNIRISPRWLQVKKVEKAIPQFEMGYSHWKQNLLEIAASLSSRLLISGSYWTGVAINDCIAQARHLAQSLVHRVKEEEKS